MRVPRLLTLQNSSADFFLTTIYQWHELWFKVLLIDLRALPRAHAATFESTKLLRRGIALFRLFALLLDFAGAVVRETALTKSIHAPALKNFSAQLDQITTLARRLPPSDSAREYAAQLKAFRARFAKFAQATLVPKKRGAPAYAEWLRLPELLDLQDGPKAAWAEVGAQPTALMIDEKLGADENMFIVVHQCFEIWFKFVLQAIDQTIPQIQQGAIAQATTALRRVAHIQKLLNRQIEIPATMLPLDFLNFRAQTKIENGKTYFTGLSPASGTESYQFREIEIVCGLRDDAVFQQYLHGNAKLPIQLLTPRQRERLAQPTLGEAFRAAVTQRGIAQYDDLFTPAHVPNPHADLADLADALIEFDEAFHFWRIGHVSMVEKMIGAKSGTGFLGPEYLMETAGMKIQEKNRIFAERQVRPRFFEELWAVRSRMGA